MKFLLLGISFLISVSIQGQEYLDKSLGEYRPNGDNLSPIPRTILKHIIAQNNLGINRFPADPRIIFTEGNTIEKFLVESPEIWGEYSRLISKAKYEVILTTYVWFHRQLDKNAKPKGTLVVNDGVTSIGKGLFNAQKNVPKGRKLKVYFMASLNPHLKITGKNMVKEIQKSIAYWNTTQGVDLSKVEFEIIEFNHLGLGNLHDKYLIVDGKAGIISGANVEDHQNFFSERWNDSGVSFSGPAVISLINNFENSRRRKRNNFFNERTKTKFSEYRPAWPLDQLPLAEGNTPMILVAQTGRDNGKNDISSAQDIAWKTSFEEAKKSIYIRTPNFNDDQFIKGVILAASRGVDVRIISSKGFNDGSEGGFLGALLGAGGTNMDVIKKRIPKMAKSLFKGKYAQIKPILQKNLQFRWFTNDGITPHIAHTKMMIVDGTYVIQGSGNQDTSSWNFSNEINFLIDSASYSLKIQNGFFKKAWEKAIAESSPY